MSTTPLPSGTDDPVLNDLLGRVDELVHRLAHYVAFPSVGTDSAYAQGMADARAFLVDRLRALGFSGVTTLEAGGEPAVYAQSLEAPGAPTLLIYGHYDVQPPDPLDLWTTPPFTLTERDGRLYGRGVSDDKAPVLTAIEALGAFISIEGRLPINVKILLEGEEETGSRSLAAICRHHRDRLAADAVVSADGARWRADLATVNVGSRGNNGFEVTVTTAVKDLHSGRYGGAVPNALHVMAGLLAGLHRPDGAIAVSGFTDGLIPPTDAEREAMMAIPFDRAGFFDALGTVDTGEAGFDVLERLWYRPTIEVNGMWGGYTGEGSKTVIPNRATAKLTMRLGPGQDPDTAQAAVVAHLKAACPAGASVAIDDNRGGCAAYSTPLDHPLLAAVETAFARTLGTQPLRVRMGATLPLTAIMKTELGLDTVPLAFATADEDYHAPNEFFRMSGLTDGLAAWVHFVRVAATQTADDYAAYSVT
ncbi:M20/M25/M40 family metallo-hydrolase [Fodinicurvata sp. EGI_FJ10296]|uniref:M20/M25/M40 family metallo-hydrolase n=1 Tax=Fodinicurvata sp. EGI_FJ10296 TaxID=3231908 RepID=UPI003456DD57